MKRITARLHGRHDILTLSWRSRSYSPRPTRFATLSVLGSGRDVGEFAQLPSVVVGGIDTGLMQGWGT